MINMWVASGHSYLGLGLGICHQVASLSAPTKTGIRWWLDS